MKAIIQFSGVKSGDIYPSVIAAGEDIPPELEDAAIELGAAVAENGAKPAARARKAPESAAASAPETK